MQQCFKFGMVAATALIFASCVMDERASDGATKQKQSAQNTDIVTYDAADFFETTSYGMASAAGFAFSPDNADLLISSDRTGIFNAYALSVDDAAPTSLTKSSTDSTFAVSWFPDDRRMLFTRDQGGNELNHLYVRDENGAIRDLTPGDNVKASFLNWLEDGEAFHILTNERDSRYFDLYRYSASDYTREILFQNDTGWSIDAVTPDGRYAALTLSRTSADSDAYVIDLQADGAEPLHVTPHQGNIAYGIYGFTPDGQNLIYSTDEFGEFSQAWTYNIDTGEKSELIAEDWDVMYVLYSPSGRYRVWAINEDARTTLKIRDQQTGSSISSLELPKGAIGSVRFSRDETKVAFLLSSDTSPNNVVVADIKNSEIETLTNALNPAIDEDHLVEASVRRFKSYDGLDIPGVLYRPHTATADTPAPALVWVHGGPGGQSRAGYSATIQHLVNHGYAVFAINNRGSSGYGKTFFHLDDKKHGDVDLKDVVASKTWLANLEWIDEERIGIIGGSYGGYMVGAALAFEPEVFDVGVNIFGVMNWVRTLESIPPWWESFREALFDEMGDPAVHGDRHRAISPLFHAENIRAPLLVVQGANDPRVLKVESDEIVEAVRANGVPVEYLVFDDEGHGFSKRENRIAASNAYVTFLDKHLKGQN
ncbi:MAG: alpha/beta fold hydrolase [Pseudomonadota bacterium]